MITQLLGVGATVLAGGFLIPQIARLVRSRDTRGVSVTWAVFGVITNVAWVSYLVVEDLWLPALAPAIAVISYTILAFALMRMKAGSCRAWWPLYAASLALAGWCGGAHTVGIVLALTPLIQLAPEIYVVYRQVQPSGVSPATWGLSAGEALCWGAYGALVGDPALVGYGVVTSVGSALILVRWWSRRVSAQSLRPRSAMSTRPSRIAVAAASPRLAAVSLRRMFET